MLTEVSVTELKNHTNLIQLRNYLNKFDEIWMTNLSKFFKGCHLSKNVRGNSLRAVITEVSDFGGETFLSSGVKSFVDFSIGSLTKESELRFRIEST